MAIYTNQMGHINKELKYKVHYLRVIDTASYKYDSLVLVVCKTPQPAQILRRKMVCAQKCTVGLLINPVFLHPFFFQYAYTQFLLFGTLPLLYLDIFWKILVSNCSGSPIKQVADVYPPLVPDVFLRGIRSRSQGILYFHKIDSILVLCCSFNCDVQCTMYGHVQLLSLSRHKKTECPMRSQQCAHYGEDIAVQQVQVKLHVSRTV